MNYSKQREVIYQVLKSTTSHPNAQWVYENAKKIMPNISLATVYRNLNLLEKGGEIMRLQGSFNEDRFDANNKNHAHFICRRCGSVYDADILPELKRKIIEACPMAADDFSVMYMGVCDKCRNKNNN